MKPDLSQTPAHRLLDDAHAAGRELYLGRDGQLWLITANGAPKAEGVETALRLIYGDLEVMLAPWECGFCDGPAELPDGCSRCRLALRHYARDGAGFTLGAFVFHALKTLEGDYELGTLTTACGVDLQGGPLELPYRDRLRADLADLPPALLCRRCLPVLHRQHADHLAAHSPTAKKGGRRCG